MPKSQVEWVVGRADKDSANETGTAAHTLRATHQPQGAAEELDGRGGEEEGPLPLGHRLTHSYVFCDPSHRISNT